MYLLNNNDSSENEGAEMLSTSDQRLYMPPEPNILSNKREALEPCAERMQWSRLPVSTDSGQPSRRTRSLSGEKVYMEQ